MIDNKINANKALQDLVGKINALWSGKAKSSDRLSPYDIMCICRYIADELEADLKTPEKNIEKY